jgi:hypothetical protein
VLNDDYYSIDFPGGSFYCGYECSYCHDCKEWLTEGREYCDKDESHQTSWGFHGKIGDFEKRYPVTMGYQFDVARKMEEGIAKFMGEYQSYISRENKQGK